MSIRWCTCWMQAARCRPLARSLVRSSAESTLRKTRSCRSRSATSISSRLIPWFPSRRHAQTVFPSNGNRRTFPCLHSRGSVCFRQSSRTASAPLNLIQRELLPQGLVLRRLRLTSTGGLFSTPGICAECFRPSSKAKSTARPQGSFMMMLRSY